MAKKKSTKNLSYIKYGAIAFAVIGLIMTVFTFVTYGDLGSYTGIQQIFGYSEKSGIITLNILSFSFMTLLAVILPLIGSISVLFKNKIFRIIGTVVMIAGCILTFLAPNFVVFASESAFTNYLNPTIGIGAILAGVFFGLGALCNLYAVVEKE